MAVDRYPGMWKETAAGELTVERDGLYAVCSVCCHPPGDGLWCIWAAGDRGEVRLGVPEPGAGGFTLRRRLSLRSLEEAGCLRRGELRPASEDGWTLLPQPEAVFRGTWLRSRLRETKGALLRRETDGVTLAFPYTPAAPFPLVPMFCFVSLRMLRGERYWCISFDREERPVFR